MKIPFLSAYNMKSIIWNNFNLYKIEIKIQNVCAQR